MVAHEAYKVSYLNRGLVIQCSLLHQIELTTERSGISSKECER